MSITIRAAISSDIPAMAAIRASEWQTPEYWIARISGYLAGYHSPPKALPARTIFVATENNLVVAFVAGHLTTRFACHAELEWITVLAEKRGQGIAGLLLEKIARWFIEQNALRICVDPMLPHEACTRNSARRPSTAIGWSGKIPAKCSAKHWK